MKSLQESLLDDEIDVIDSTDINTVVDNKIKKLPKVKWLTGLNDPSDVYEVEMAWLRIFDVIMGNMSDFNTYKIKLFLKLLQHWFPKGLVEEPSDAYDDLTADDEDEAKLKETIHFLKQIEYRNMQQNIQKVIDKPEIKYEDLSNLVYRDIFGEKFVEFASDAYVNPFSHKLSKQINDGLIKIGFGDIVKWAKDNLNTHI